MLHECNQCNYRSNQPCNFTAHMVTHSRVKSFKCSQCEFISYQSNNLRTNIKIYVEARHKNVISVITGQTEQIV